MLCPDCAIVRLDNTSTKKLCNSCAIKNARKAAKTRLAKEAAKKQLASIPHSRIYTMEMHKPNPQPLRKLPKNAPHGGSIDSVYW